MFLLQFFYRGLYLKYLTGKFSIFAKKRSYSPLFRKSSPLFSLLSAIDKILKKQIFNLDKKKLEHIR